MKGRIFAFALLLVYFIVPAAFAQNYRPLQTGPYHEAFVSRSPQSVVLEAISKRPPANITERIPQKGEPGAIWIPGYWAWAPDYGRFIWVSGVWRIPPPGRQWIPGIWQQFDEGWVWIPGFWSEVPEAKLAFLEKAPPDGLDENQDSPPSSHYFWVPGTWIFSSETHQYEWFSGQWETRDPNWVYVPAHYVWRPGGYVYVSGYWDWPLDRMGRLYAPILIEPSSVAEIVYEPIVVVAEEVLVPNLVIDYPDYASFFEHHHYYHPEFWEACNCSPPWWRWDTWWSYRWADQWALWWWYTHPGYPSPEWMNQELSASIAPPSPSLLNMFKGIKGPAIITPKGVVSSTKMIGAITEVLDKAKSKFMPVLPANEKLSSEIGNMVEPKKVPSSQWLKPTGKLSAEQLAKNPPLKEPVVLEVGKDVAKPAQISPIALPTKPNLPLDVKPLKSALEREAMKPKLIVPSPAAPGSTPYSTEAPTPTPATTTEPVIKKIIPSKPLQIITPPAVKTIPASIPQKTKLEETPSKFINPSAPPVQPQSTLQTPQPTPTPLPATPTPRPTVESRRNTRENLRERMKERLEQKGNLAASSGEETNSVQ